MNNLDRLLEGWGCKKSATSQSATMVPTAVLERLVELALGKMVYSEADYLHSNADVDKAVKEKKLLSGFQHYIWQGIVENRALLQSQVDTIGYLGKNPDLAEVDALQGRDALERHWREIGWLEGRIF